MRLAAIGLTMGASGFRVSYIDFNITDALDTAADPVSDSERANACGCSGVDKIAWRQHAVGRNLGNRLRDGPYHLFKIALLPGLIINGEPDASTCRVPDFVK